MKQRLRAIYKIVTAFGVDPRRMIGALRGLLGYGRDFVALCRQRRVAVRRFPFGMPYPCLHEKFEESGSARGHYFHQDLLVARRIYRNAPNRHVDVGSRIDGFVAHVAVFRPIEVVDIRPLSSEIVNVKFLRADLMGTLDGQLVDCCDSLSCLHALEHFGLGRYGDPVDGDGYILGLNNLYKLLKRDGKLYLSVPLGPQRIEFNAHRVFSLPYLLELLAAKYRIDQFSFVDDRGDLHEDIALTKDKIDNNCGCHYGCAIFELTKQ